MAKNNNAQLMQTPVPDPAFKGLEKLVGTWKMNGRTFDSKEDNIFGEITIQPILSGAYLELRGHMNFNSGTLDFPSLEIIHYDAGKDTFPSAAYANMGRVPGGTPTPYEWEIEKDGTVIHRGAGATYRGKFSEDGNVLAGGWRPNKGADERAEANYDLTMTRVK